MVSQASSHDQYWTNLLADLEGISWPRIISILMSTNHGFSNYQNCKKRNHTQIRQEVFEDEKVRNFASVGPDNAEKVRRVLDEMCHLLATQTSPTRKLKWTGGFFMKCITRIYSGIYVNTHLLPMAKDLTDSGVEQFRIQFLKLSSKMPVVILPTHRSYMDFLFITYVMFINELPLPIVAAGDNFKALGSLLTNYLKATGAFLIRRNANNKRDIEASDYFDILRAYVHSIVGGGENPIEFFMEGTRTRLGQVLRPKTGLLSMVVDMYLEKLVGDICILPVSINYQRPMEEQLYINEMTPQISKSKPKETAKNLLAAFDKITKRKYGKVYVRFLEPFKLSDYHEQWAKAIGKSADSGVDESDILHDLTNSLASKVCLAQANHNVLMPFNLMTYSMMARSFLANEDVRENFATGESGTMLTIEDVTRDFLILEDLLKSMRPEFVAGWRGHLDILDEFKIDRDGLIRASSDRRTVQFEYDARTFHTFAYYSNQVMQILLPIAINSLLSNDHDLAGDRSTANKFDHYKSIRSLLSREFLVHDLGLEREFTDGLDYIEKGLLCNSARDLILKHLQYYMDSYLIFLRYLKQVGVLVKSEFFQKTISENGNHFISKDMLNNMMNLVKDLEICSIIQVDEPKSSPTTSKRPEEQLKVQSKEKIVKLIDQFQDVLNRLHQVNLSIK